MTRAFDITLCLLGGGLIVAALLSFGLGTGSASAPRWLAIYALAGGGLVWLLLNRTPRLGAVDIAAGAFLGWASLSLLWSPDHLAGLWQFQNMAALFAVALFVRHAKAFDSLILPVFIISALALVALGVSIPHLHGGVGNENFQAETLLLLLPVIIIVSDRRQWLPALSLLAIMVVVLYLFLGNGSHAQYAVLAACVAAVGLWLVRLWGWKGAVALALVCGAVVAEAPIESPVEIPIDNTVDTQPIAAPEPEPALESVAAPEEPQVQEIQMVQVTDTGIFIQAGAFSQYENASRVYSTLSAIGDAQISQVLVNDVDLYRVRVGPIINVADADMLLGQVMSAGYPNARIIVE